MAGTTNLIPGAQNFLATPTGAAFLKMVGQTGGLNISKLSLAQKNYFFSQLRDYLNKPGNTPAGPAPTQAQATIQFSGQIIKPASNGNAYGQPVVYASASEMKFNLPPHKWSLPLDRTAMDTGAPVGPAHALRRARMYFYGSTTTNANTKLQITSTSSTNNLPADSNYVITEADNYWGFQFLWNPTDISSAVSRNANFTPSSTDVLAGMQGLFTAMETIQFTIVIDRVNDFAWAAGASGGVRSVARLLASVGSAGNPYTAGGNPGVVQDQIQQINDLLNKGTMADVEYLFRAINGKGNNGKTWTNALGRETADIGFLSPNPIALELGPNGDNLSYVGWVDGLAIKHSIFTQDMLPLHTEIQVTFNAFSRTSLKSTS